MASEKMLTIATYNIQFAINAEKILANIEKMAKGGVAVFCLQEIINVRGEKFFIDKLLSRLGKNWKAAYHVGPEFSKLSIGTGIVWNTKILKFKREDKLLLPKLKNFDRLERLYYKVVGVHAIPLQRKVTICYFAYGKKTIRVTSIHIDNVGGPGHRMKQLSYLLATLHKHEVPDGEIICGDFNTFDLLKTGYEKLFMQKLFGDDFKDASRHAGWTSDIYNIDFRTSMRFFPWLIKTFHIHIRRRLDYIWVKHMNIVSCRKLPIPGSDHYPLVARLKMKNT
jgi:endonuclease/exonuclease/phosphatase family metal-dependent hydrolase